MIIKTVLKNDEINDNLHIGIDVFKQTAYNENTVIETYFNDSNSDVNALLSMIYALRSLADHCQLNEYQLLKLIAGIYRIDDNLDFEPSNEIDESGYDTFGDTDESRFDYIQ